MTAIQAYVCFVILGACGLLPWNVFVTAFKYFEYKLRNVTTNATGDYAMSAGDDTPTYAREFEAWFTVAASGSALAGTVVNALLANRVSNWYRLVAGHMLVAPVLAASAALAMVDTDQYQPLFFYGTLGLLVVGTFAASGLVTGGTMGLAARLPPSAMHAALLGQALCGVAASAASIGAQAAMPDPLTSGCAYFGVGTAFTCVSLLAYCAIVRTEYARTHMAENNDDLDRLLSDSNSDSDSAIENEIIDRFSPPSIRTVAGKIAGDSAIICFVFIVTLSIFPSLACLVRTASADVRWQAYFTPVICFFMFNMFDAVGRLSVSFVNLGGTYISSLIAVVRIPLAGIIVVSNIMPRHHMHITLLAGYDWPFAIALALIAVSNGYLVTSATTRACNILAVVCTTAIGLGSAAALLLLRLV